MTALVYGATVTASSTQGNYKPQNVIDGRDTTRWSSNRNDNEWIMLDLGEDKSIGKIVLKWEEAAGKEYSVQVSSDGENFTEVFRKTDGKKKATVDDRHRSGDRAIRPHSRHQACEYLRLFALGSRALFQIESVARGGRRNSGALFFCRATLQSRFHLRIRDEGRGEILPGGESGEDAGGFAERHHVPGDAVARVRKEIPADAAPGENQIRNIRADERTQRNLNTAEPCTDSGRIRARTTGSGRGHRFRRPPCRRRRADSARKSDLQGDPVKPP